MTEIRNKNAPDGEDIIRWPDGSWCYREELDEYGWKSDDYETIPFGTAEWERIVTEKEGTPSPA